MKLTSLAYGLAALFAGQASATALTYKLVANEKACFYANNQDKGQKIAFYFAVRLIPEFQVPQQRLRTNRLLRFNPEVLSMSISRLQAQ